MPNITKPGWFLLLLTAFVATAVLLVSLQIPEGESGIWARVLYVWREIEPLVVVAAIVVLIVVEGFPMLAEKFLKERYWKGRKEGHQQGREEANRAWEAWNERRLKARKEHRAFDEPPPGQRETPA